MTLSKRSDLVQAQRRNPRSARRPGAVRAGMTGSGDTLLVLTWTASELAQERAAGVRLLNAAGLSAGMRVANTLAGALATPGSLQLGDVVDELGGLDVPLGTIDTDAAAKQAWELVDRVEANVLVLDPCSAARFLSAAPPTPRPWWSGIIWSSTDFVPAPPPALSDTCRFGGWQRRWLAVPEVTSFAAITCERDVFHPDMTLRVAVVDVDRASAVAPGETGYLALSLSDQQPLYASCLQTRLLTQPCLCARPGIAFEVAP
ncbi:MAG: hypothetical protein HY270_07215 [Deltaproteobacteria bacterium]|nr:hypothetical protein [Deltaproteobacteria bacterium]